MQTKANLSRPRQANYVAGNLMGLISSPVGRLGWVSHMGEVSYGEVMLTGFRLPRI